MIDGIICFGLGAVCALFFGGRTFFRWGKEEMLKTITRNDVIIYVIGPAKKVEEEPHA